MNKNNNLVKVYGISNCNACCCCLFGSHLLGSARCRNSTDCRSSSDYRLRSSVFCSLVCGLAKTQWHYAGKWRSAVWGGTDEWGSWLRDKTSYQVIVWGCCLFPRGSVGTSMLLWLIAGFVSCHPAPYLTVHAYTFRDSEVRNFGLFLCPDVSPAGLLHENQFKNCRVLQ